MGKHIRDNTDAAAQEADDRITEEGVQPALRYEISDRMRIAVEALEPFKLAADNMDGDEPDSLFIYDSPESTLISYADLRRAASAYSALKSTAAKEGGE